MKISKTRFLLLFIILISLYFFMTNLKEGLDVQKTVASQQPVATQKTYPVQQPVASQKESDKRKVDSLIVSAITDKLNLYVPFVSTVFNSFIEAEQKRVK